VPEYDITRLRGGWAISWWEDGTDAEGRPARRRRRFSLGATDRKEAEAVAARRWAILTKPNKVTVQYLWDRYRAENDQKRMAENMTFSGRAVLPFFGHLEAGDFNVDLCRTYITKRRKAGRQDGTIWTELNHLQIVLNWAAKHHHIPRQVALHRPPKPAPRDIRIDRNEARRLRDAAPYPHVKLAIALMIGTGARIGAILGLTWDRVDLKTGIIKLGDSADVKRRKGRATVPAPADLLEALRQAKQSSETDYVIEWGGRAPVGSIKRGFSVAAERSGLPQVTPHVIRHSGASWLAEDGESMEEIAQLLGHSDSRTTAKIYARFSPQFLKRISSRLDLSGVPSGSREPGNENEK
jgi:integrase